MELTLFHVYLFIYSQIFFSLLVYEFGRQQNDCLSLLENVIYLSACMNDCYQTCCLFLDKLLQTEMKDSVSACLPASP